MILGIVITIMMVGVNIIAMMAFGLNWMNSISGMFCAGCFGFCIALNMR